MQIRVKALALVALVPMLAGCDTVRAKSAFRDGNKNYKEEKFKQAIEDYTKAVGAKDDFAEAWFYLGSSHQALFRPGKDDTKVHLDEAIKDYEKSLAVNKNTTPNEQTVKRNTLGALTAIFAEDPYRDFDKAFGYAQQLVADNPDDPKNQYAIANLYEKFGKIAEAEGVYRRVGEQHPQDVKACGALAAFLNKPLWDETGAVWAEGSDKAKRSKFDEAISILEKCAAITPDDPAGFQKVATFFWDKAFRDPTLTDAQKMEYADRGLVEVGRALAIKPDYFEALIYKGLLLRVKAGATKDPRAQAQLIEQAKEAQAAGLAIKKQQAEAAVTAPPAE